MSRAEQDDDDKCREKSRHYHPRDHRLGDL